MIEPPMTPQSKYMAEITRSAIFIWEFINDSKTMICQLQRNDHSVRESIRLVTALNKGEEYV